MNYTRIIPRLDIKGHSLVKGIHLEGLRVLGKPEDFAKYYYEHGADELIYQDVVASLFERNSLHEVISITAKEIFIPLIIGGGLRTLNDIKEVLRAGADKVALNTAAIRNPAFIREASRKFGSSTILVSIEAIKQPGGEYLAFTDNGREHTGIEVSAWAQKAEELGAGQIMITSVDREGTGEGFDIELVNLISSSVSIPVIAHGGACSPKNMADTVLKGKANGLAIGSILHYAAINKLKSEPKHIEGNLNFRESGKTFSMFPKSSIEEIKNHLEHSGIYCRPYSPLNA